MTDTEPDTDQEVEYQSNRMLSLRCDALEKQVKDLWRRIHSLSETIEARDVH